LIAKNKLGEYDTPFGNPTLVLKHRARASFDAVTGFPENEAAKETLGGRWMQPVTASNQNKAADKVDYSDLKDATGGFSEMCKIGGGGSCLVYRGNLYGMPVAIKALENDGGGKSSASNGIQDWNGLQFKAEMDLLCRVRHPNICRLFASSSNGPRRCLVLEWMGGGSLDARLGVNDPSCKESSRHPPLRWQQRNSILLDVASGLTHLHSLTPPIIHRQARIHPPSLSPHNRSRLHSHKSLAEM
jgi:serine/threonine protein kinase